MSRSQTVEAIVLKRTALGEADLIVTFYSKELGKVAAMAKGVRKISSKRASSLEPAMLGKYALIHRTGLGMLTETQIISNLSPHTPTLVHLTKIQQCLEIVDLLTVEHEANEELFCILKTLLQGITDGSLTKTAYLEYVRQILKTLGFTHDKQFSEKGLKNYIEELANKKLRSKQYLAV